MKHTATLNIRHCDNCAKDVFLISSKEELLESIELNRCVAIQPLNNYSGKTMLPTLGVPSKYQDSDMTAFEDDIPF